MNLPSMNGALVLVLLAAPTLTAQQLDKAGHAAWAVQFRGGDERIARLKGSDHPANLVLTDSTVRLYFTSNNYELPDYEIPIRRITDLSGRSNRVGASLTNWATGDESLTIVYDGNTDAEAPVFKTDGNESAQIVARIRYRMRKLGVIP